MEKIPNESRNTLCFGILKKLRDTSCVLVGGLLGPVDQETFVGRDNLKSIFCRLTNQKNVCRCMVVLSICYGFSCRLVVIFATKKAVKRLSKLLMMQGIKSPC